MKTLPLIAALTLVATPAFAADTSKADIEKVVSQFQGALKAHDGKTLGSLFIPESSWVEALGPEGLITVHAKKAGCLALPHEHTRQVRRLREQQQERPGGALP